VEKGRASGVGLREGGPGGVICAVPKGDSYLCNSNVDAAKVGEFGWGDESGSVTELGGWLLVGRWSRVSEMEFDRKMCAGLYIDKSRENSKCKKRSMLPAMNQ
jgi:hypothetical protein